MLNLLVFKERLNNIYQKYQMYIIPCLKFIVAFIVFTFINQRMGYDTRLTGIPVVLLLSVISAFLPSTIMVLLAALVTLLHVYAVSPFLTIVVAVILVILYLLLIRFTPKLSYIVLAMPILYFFKVPYVIPLLLGMTAAPISILPVFSGIVVFHLMDSIKTVATITTSSSLEDIIALYQTVIDSLVTNKVMFLTICAFAVVLLVTYVISNLSIDHAFRIAIISGGVVNILLFLIGDIMFEASNEILFMVIGTIASCLIVFVVQFFQLNLEYSGVERVQFEDDDYYYYVKAVPKIKITTPEKSVKRFREESPEEKEEVEVEDIKIDVSDMFQKQKQNRQEAYEKDIKIDYDNSEDEDYF